MSTRGESPSRRVSSSSDCQFSTPAPTPNRGLKHAKDFHLGRLCPAPLLPQLLAQPRRHRRKANAFSEAEPGRDQVRRRQDRPGLQDLGRSNRAGRKLDRLWDGSRNGTCGAPWPGQDQQVSIGYGWSAAGRPDPPSWRRCRVSWGSGRIREYVAYPRREKAGKAHSSHSRGGSWSVNR
jgi:hypothetical protein